MNVVWHARAPAGTRLPPGPCAFETGVALGTLDEVRATLSAWPRPDRPKVSVVQSFMPSLRKSRALVSDALREAATFRRHPAGGATLQAVPLVLYVSGTFCPLKVKLAEGAVLQEQLSAAAGVPVQVRCNPKTAAPFENIGKTFCSVRPSKSSAFVAEIERAVRGGLDMGRRVLLMGHSYGGSVAARVAELLRDHPRAAQQLKVATFGTIYAPDPSRTGGIEVLHGFDIFVSLEALWIRPMAPAL